MGIKYGSTFTGVRDGTVPARRADGGLVGAKRRIIREVIDLAKVAVASGDQIYLGALPIGAYFAGGRIIASATMGTSTIAIGSSASTGKYRAAATFTAVDTITGFGTAAAFAQAALTAPEDVFATIAAAALPGAGTLVIEMEFLVVA